MPHSIRACFLLLSALAASTVSALTSAEWRAQSVYQVLTDRFALTNASTDAPCNYNNYCGGTWLGIINHLDYIQDMGFTAIWISPVVENLAQNTYDGEAYHGYWAQDIYAINENFGTVANLQALSAALHSRGMYLMVDINVNNMAYAGDPASVDYAVLNPFNSESYYHINNPFCFIDYYNYTSIQVCWEGDDYVSLPDLRTETAAVYNVWNSWIKELVSNYSIDGLRIDSAQQVDTAFWNSFQEAAGVYAVGEVFNTSISYTCSFQQYLDGVLNYPAWSLITEAFQSTGGSMSNLANGIQSIKSDCADTTLLGSFLENHDNPRFPSLTSDLSLAKNAIAFTMLADGIPIIYEGQEQHYAGGTYDNDNRQPIWPSEYSTTASLYTFITQLNAIRQQAIVIDDTYLTYQAYPTFTNSETIAMRKGYDYPLIGVFTNVGADGDSTTITLPSSETGFSDSQSVIEVLSCTSYRTDSSGNLVVSISGGLPNVFYPAAQLENSAICPSLTCSTSLPTSIAVTFEEFVATEVGQTIKIAGSVSQLGSWDTSDAVALSASNYTATNNEWYGTVNFTAGEVIEFKAIIVGSSGTVTYEADPNHTYTVPSGCAATATVKATFQET